MGRKLRIAQLTLDGYFNYGTILQKFALHHTLKKFADFTEVRWPSLRWGGVSFFEVGDGKLLEQYVRHDERHNWKTKILIREAIRQSKFRDFENLHIRTRFNLPYLEETADEYDFFVVGSDQIWNTRWNPPYIFLDFVPREKKIAYAASLNAGAIPDEKKETFRRGISDFNYLSVREKNAVKIIEELTGKTPLHVLDPVLLLTADEWLAVAQKPTWLKERYSRGYVLTYHLSKLPPPEIKQFADKLDLPVINLLDTENYNHFTVGPAEFVWLFANASLIYTNSFHGTAFSSLFKIPFILNALRNIKDTRLRSFLSLFGLIDRMTNVVEPMKIDFTRRDEVLPIERAKAFNFLAEAFGINPLEKLLGGDA